MKALLILIATLMAFNAGATDLNSEMDALGANKDLMRKAKAIDPENRIRVVQHRDVDRYNRLEIGVGMGLAEGGETYVDTSLLGLQADYHFTPHWSLGARFYNDNNSLNPEGRKVFADVDARRANGDVNFRQPGIDYAKNEWLVIGNFYPIYGKLNFFDSSIAQFDIYLLGGAGQIALGSGSSPVYTAGLGIGVWLTQHLSTRFEARWQEYKDHPFDGVDYYRRTIDQTILTATIGFML